MVSGTLRGTAANFMAAMDFVLSVAGLFHSKVTDMITVDFVGLLLTSCIVGVRYPVQLVFAIVIHEAGRVVLALFFQGHIDAILVSGVFSATSVSQLSEGFKLALVAFGGPAANYVLSSTIGGVEWEKTKNLLNPFSLLRHPFAVINLRFATVSFVISIIRLF